MLKYTLLVAVLLSYPSQILAEPSWVDSLLEVALQPINAANHRALDMNIAWHGRLMVVAWLGLLPIGVLIARFYKVTPGQNWPQQLDNPFWWHSHRILQYSGIAVMVIALYFVIRVGSDSADVVARVHRLLGWTVIILACAQLCSGLLRGSKGGPTEQTDNQAPLSGDHYDMSVRRKIFEYVHKILGYTVLALALVTVLLGLWIAVAPLWMWFCLGCWCVVYTVVFARLQMQGRCFDTYQAIWGPELHHPGNRLRPIGWGIKRCRPGESPP